MKTKEQKSKIVEKLLEKINKYPSIILTEYTGLTMSALDSLRGQLLGKSASYDEPDLKFEIIKNNLLNLALKKTAYKDVMSSVELKGPIAVLWSRNILDGAKIISNFSKENRNLKLKFGISDGRVITAKDIITLSELPSAEVLVVKLIGILKSPLANFVNVINAPTRNLVLILNQKAKIQERKS